MVRFMQLKLRSLLKFSAGWACANSVAWNIRTTGRIDVQSPPGSANLCVGCVGNINRYFVFSIIFLQAAHYSLPLQRRNASVLLFASDTGQSTQSVRATADRPHRARIGLQNRLPAYARQSAAFGWK